MGFSCFSCGSQITLGTNNKAGMRETCSCGADLHCCKNCEFFDLSCYNECRESQAERVLEKERANRCDYFRFGEGGGPSDRKSSAKSSNIKALDDLFK